MAAINETRITQQIAKSKQGVSGGRRWNENRGRFKFSREIQTFTERQNRRGEEREQKIMGRRGERQESDRG